MVSKIKDPRNYLSCCHVLTAMGRGWRADGASSRRNPGRQARPQARTYCGHLQPRLPPTQGWGLGHLPEPGPEKVGSDGGVVSICSVSGP